MKRGASIVLCIALICIGYYGGEGLCNTEGGGASATSSAELATPGKTPRLTVPESLHSFGQIYRGEKVQHYFLLKNAGEAELEIRKVRPSCGCTAAEPSQKVVLPGGEAHVEVTFDSKNFVGKVTKTVMVDTNDPSEPTHTLTLEANIIEELVAKPPRLALGQIKQKEGLNSKVEIKSPTGLNFEVYEAQSSSRALGVASVEKQADDTYAISLEVKKDSPTGRFGGDLVVRTSSQRQPVISIPFIGEVVSDVSAYPAQLSFGFIKKGSEVVTHVLVTFHDPEVRLGKVEVEPEVFSLRVDPPMGGQSQTSYNMVVVLSREAPTGRHEGSLKIHTTSNSNPLIIIPISATVKE